MIFSERVEKLLKEKGKTKAEVAKIAEITTQTFYDWKKKGAVPSADTAVKLAQILGTTVEYLITGVEPPVVEKIPRDLQDIINKYAEKDEKKQKKDLTNEVLNNYNLSKLPPP